MDTWLIVLIVIIALIFGATVIYWLLKEGYKQATGDDWPWPIFG